MSARNTYLFVGGLLLLAVARVSAVWDALPTTMASHFGASGAPDGWVGKTEFLTLYAATVVFTTAMLMVVPWSLRLMPVSWVNLPNKDFWLAPERRDQSIERIARYMRMLAASTVLLTVVVLELVLRANLGRAGLENTPFIVLLVAYLGFTGVWTVQLVRAFAKPQQ